MPLERLLFFTVLRLPDDDVKIRCCCFNLMEIMIVKMITARMGMKKKKGSVMYWYNANASNLMKQIGTHT